MKAAIGEVVWQALLHKEEAVVTSQTSSRQRLDEGEKGRGNVTGLTLQARRAREGPAVLREIG